MEYEDVVATVQGKYSELTQSGFGSLSGPGNIRPEAVQQCVMWLLKHDALDRRKTVNVKISSYAWKHAVERACGAYIAEGEFICAALYLGYKMKVEERNAFFNIRSVEKQ